MVSWTKEVITWSEDAEILLGIPAYNDAGVGYHDPRIENLPNAILGINSGLNRWNHLPKTYRGVSIYSEWEMDQGEWTFFRNAFLGRRSSSAGNAWEQ